MNLSLRNKMVELRELSFSPDIVSLVMSKIGINRYLSVANKLTDKDTFRIILNTKLELERIFYDTEKI